MQNPLKKMIEWVADALVEKITEPIKDLGRRVDKLDARMDAIKKCVDELKELHEQDEAALEADLSVMDDRICHLISVCMKRGYTTADERRRITRMHHAYKARGGNHGEENEFARFLSLPTEEEFERTKGE